MNISHFKVKNFRNIISADVNFNNLNIITGKNASGKSNLLLAISQSLNTNSDLTNCFFDNGVTYGKGISVATIAATISDIKNKTITADMIKKQACFFEPQIFNFEKTINKQSIVDTQRILCSGQYSCSTLKDFGAFNSIKSFGEMEKVIAANGETIKLNLDTIFHKDFRDEKQMDIEGGTIKSIKATEKNKKVPDIYEPFLKIFTDFQNKVIYWINHDDLSPAQLHKYVTKRNDNSAYEEAYHRVMQGDSKRLTMKDFKTAKFLHLIADIQSNKKAHKDLNEDLNLYTQGIIQSIKVNTSGSIGNKGELVLSTPSSPKDIFYVSTGTSVMLYFIVLNNWMKLTPMQRSFSRPHILIFDEIDSIIHPTVMEEFAEVLKSLSKKVQLFIATHSPTFIDYFVNDQVFWLRDNHNNNKNHSCVISFKDALKLAKKSKPGIDLFELKNSELFIDGIFDEINI